MVSRVALKEWAVVVEALGLGRQILLVRKGGIRDERGAFELKQREFLLYPTLEHQRPEEVRPEFQELLKRSQGTAAPESGQIRFQFYAGVAYDGPLRDPARLAALEKYHIWGPSYIEERARYRPQAPLQILALRAYRLPRPLLHSIWPEYAGCRSWVDLAEPVSLEGAEPVLDNRKFRAALEEIREKLEER